MKNNIFRPDNSFWSLLGKLSDILGLSLLFLLCSLPLITLGPSAAALYDCTVHNLRRGESGVYARFFRTLKNEWKTGALSTLLWGAAGFALYWYYGVIVTGANAGVSYMLALKYAVPLLLLVPAGAFCWLFPLLSRFTQSFGQLNKNAFKVAVAFLPRTLLCVLIAIALVTASVLWLAPLCFTPVLLMFLFSLLMEPVMKKLQENGDQASDAPPRQ